MLVLKRIIIPSTVILLLVLFFFVFTIFITSVVQSKVNQRIEYFSKLVEEKTGINIQHGEISVSLFGKVTLEKLSASFHPHGLPFLSFSGVEVTAQPGPWFTFFAITNIMIRDFSLRLSPDMLKAYTDNIKLIYAVFPARKNRGESTISLGNAAGGYVRAAESIKTVIKSGRINVARDIKGWFGRSPVLTGCRMTFLINTGKREATGEFNASSDNKAGNVAGSFSFMPNYRTISFSLRRFCPEKLLSFFPASIKLQPDSYLDALLSVHNYTSDPDFHIDLKGYVNNFTIANSLLASQPVRDIKFGCKGKFIFNSDNKTIKTDELLFISGQAPLYFRDLSVQLPFDRGLVCEMRVETDHLPVQHIIDSLPEELIPHIKGARVDGYMNVSASLVLDLESIDNTNLDIDGGISGFRVITPPPECDVRSIRSKDYMHKKSTANGGSVSLTVGPANSDFIALKNAGRFVIESVLTCEDGNFYVHDGFQLKHINGAIRQNLAEKTFVRGASTVSMQLVKNLFLTNEKTVSRKLEEIMLTWWMEQEVDKKRMFEVYLNIVEWGPDIFGIGPAAKHYFQCKPHELSCTQAAWLANILINPSLFYYQKTAGKIDESMRSCIRFAMNAMRKQGGISEAVLNEAEKKNYEVYFPKDVQEAGDKGDMGEGKDIVISE